MTAPRQSKIHIKRQVRERIGNRESIREGDIGTAPHNRKIILFGASTGDHEKIGSSFWKRFDSTTLDKLPAIRGDRVRTDPDWETWDFLKLTEAQQEWVRRNPVDKNAERERDENKRKRDHHNRLFQARGGDFKVKGCVYCGDENHKAIACNKVTNIIERKRILAQKGLCFNCATRNHRAAECPSKTSCQSCKGPDTPDAIRQRDAIF